MARTPELMVASRAAEFLGISRETLRLWCRKGMGPPRERKGKRYWYSREAMKEWLRSGASTRSPEAPRPALAAGMNGGATRYHR